VPGTRVERETSEIADCVTGVSRARCGANPHERDAAPATGTAPVSVAALVVRTVVVAHAAASRNVDYLHDDVGDPARVQPRSGARPEPRHAGTHRACAPPPPT